MLPDPGFWNEEERRLWAELVPLITRVMLAGAESGISELPIEVSLLMNWEVFNQAAIEFLNEYRLTWVHGISETTRTQSMASIAAWIESGEPLPALTERLAMILGEGRASAVAVTEVTRVFAAGNQQAWESTGLVAGKQWRTARDGLVTPICRALEGQVANLDGLFVVPPEAMARADVRKMVAQFGSTFTHPPAHPNCRSWVVPVVSEELLIEQIDRILEEG